MPEQPDDPIHYDMKIPPETKPGEKPGTEGRHVPEDEADQKNGSSESESGSDTTARGGDQPQGVRQHE